MDLPIELLDAVELLRNRVVVMQMRTAELLAELEEENVAPDIVVGPIIR